MIKIRVLIYFWAAAATLVAAQSKGRQTAINAAKNGGELFADQLNDDYKKLVGAIEKSFSALNDEAMKSSLSDDDEILEGLRFDVIWNWATAIVDELEWLTDKIWNG